MAAANLGLSAGKRGFPPACGGSGTGQWTRCVLLLTDRARVRTVLPVRLRGALPGPAPHTLAGVWMWVASRPLVPVGSTPRGASTSGLSTTCSAWGLQRLGAAWNPYLGEGFPLRCFQRLSLPNVANRPRHWRDDRHTRGSSTQVLSYYGQASSRFQRAQRIETKLSHDVLNPARVPLYRRTAEPLGPAPAPGCDEPTSRCQTIPSIWTLGNDQPVIPGVPFIR